MLLTTKVPAVHILTIVYFRNVTKLIIYVFVKCLYTNYLIDWLILFVKYSTLNAYIKQKETRRYNDRITHESRKRHLIRIIYFIILIRWIKNCISRHLTKTYALNSVTLRICVVRTLSHKNALWGKPTRPLTCFYSLKKKSLSTIFQNQVIYGLLDLCLCNQLTFSVDWNFTLKHLPPIQSTQAQRFDSQWVNFSIFGSVLNMIWSPSSTVITYTITNNSIECLILHVISLGEACQYFVYNPLGNRIPCHGLNLYKVNLPSLKQYQIIQFLRC